MDDEQVNAELGDSDARYREFMMKGHMTKEQFEAMPDASFWADWRIIIGVPLVVLGTAAMMVTLWQWL